MKSKKLVNYLDIFKYLEVWYYVDKILKFLIKICSFCLDVWYYVGKFFLN